MVISKSLFAPTISSHISRLTQISVPFQRLSAPSQHMLRLLRFPCLSEGVNVICSLQSDIPVLGKYLCFACSWPHKWSNKRWKCRPQSINLGWRLALIVNLRVGWMLPVAAGFRDGPGLPRIEVLPKSVRRPNPECRQSCCWAIGVLGLI